MACTDLKFAHFTANQAILEAFNGAARVHIIDFGVKDGMQWPALMQALALRPGSPPAIRLTGIGPPQSDNADALQQVGWKLAQLAETIGVEFEFRGLVTNSLADLDPEMLNGPGQVDAVAVNSVCELHRLLGQPGEIEKVLNLIKGLSPKIVTVVEQEGNNIFDSTRARLNSAGFRPVHLGSNAFKQASMILSLFSDGNGYRVEENEGCLLLARYTQLLIATSAWESV